MPTVARLDVEIATNLARLQSDMNKAANIVEQQAKRINSVLDGIGSSFGAIGAGLLFGKIFEEAAGAERAMKQVEQTIRSTGGVAGVTKDQIAALSAEIQRTTGVSDDLVTEMNSVLLTFTKVGKDVFPAATRAIVDMSARLGQDLKSTSIQVGKALQDPIKGVQALARVGVSFSESQKAVIKELVNTGRELDAQKLILKELETEFGGAAAAARDTLGGAFEALKVEVLDVLENIGTSNAGGLRAAIEGAIVVFQELKENAGPLSDGLRAVAAGGAAIIALKLGAQFGAIATSIGTAVAALGPWGIALVAATAATAGLWNTQLSLLGSTKTLGQTIIEFGKGALTALKNFGNGAIGTLVSVGQTFMWLRDQWLLFQEGNNFGAMKPLDMSKITQNFKTDFIGNAIAPVSKAIDDLRSKVEKNMSDIAAAAGRAKTKTGVFAEPEGKEEKKAREKLEKQLEHERKTVQQIVAGMRDKVDQLKLALVDQKRMIPELEAEKKILSQQHLTWKEKAAAIAQVKKLAAEARELQRQVDIKKEGEALKSMLADMKKKTQELQNNIAGQKEQNAAVEAEARLREILKVSTKEHADLIRQIQEEAQNQVQLKALEEQIEKQKQLFEEMEKERKTVSDITEGFEKQNFELQKKIDGLEDEIPFLEAIKKINEQINLTEEEKQEAIARVRKSQEENRRLTAILEDQKRVIEAVAQSKAGWKEKVAALDQALSQGRINYKQYEEALRDINREQSKASDTAHDFAHTITTSLEKAITSGKNFGSVLKNLGKELGLLAAKKLLLEPLERKLTEIGQNIFGGGRQPILPPQYNQYGMGGFGVPFGPPTYMPGYTAGGGGGGFLGGLANAGKSLLSMLGIKQFARGGWMTGGQIGLVGEEGPEFFMAPPSGGYVVPNKPRGATLQEQAWINAEISRAQKRMMLERGNRDFGILGGNQAFNTGMGYDLRNLGLSISDYYTDLWTSAGMSPYGGLGFLHSGQSQPGGWYQNYQTLLPWITPGSVPEFLLQGAREQWGLDPNDSATRVRSSVSVGMGSGAGMGIGGDFGGQWSEVFSLGGQMSNQPTSRGDVPMWLSRLMVAGGGRTPTWNPGGGKTQWSDPNWSGAIGYNAHNTIGMGKETSFPSGLYGASPDYDKPYYMSEPTWDPKNHRWDWTKMRKTLIDPTTGGTMAGWQAYKNKWFAGYGGGDQASWSDKLNTGVGKALGGLGKAISGIGRAVGKALTPGELYTGSNDPRSLHRKQDLNSSIGRWMQGNSWSPTMDPSTWDMPWNQMHFPFPAGVGGFPSLTRPKGGFGGPALSPLQHLNMPGGVGYNPSLGGFLRNFMNFGQGSGTLFSDPYRWLKRETGGPMAIDRPTLVGERGPEVLMPGGRIVPNEKLDTIGGAITINISNIVGQPLGEDNVQVEGSGGRKIEVVINEAAAAGVMAGGALSRAIERRFGLTPKAGRKASG